MLAGGDSGASFTGTASPVVPEPGSIGLLMIGALGILARRPKGHFLRGEK